MQVKEKVFILRKTRYGDTDLILNCLTSGGARISLFARGALKSKKRFGGGVLEPTHYIHVLYEDKGGTRSANPLHTLKEASLLNGFEGLRTDYARIEAALDFVRLVSEVVREGDVDSGDLFNLLGNTLRACEKTERIDRLRAHFAVKLLANQGVLPLEENAERILMRAPIADHEKVELSEAEWIRLRGRIKRMLSEYLEHTHAAH